MFYGHVDAEQISLLIHKAKHLYERDQKQFLMMSFDVVSWRLRRPRGKYVEQNPHWISFCRRVESECYIDAALMLLPDGYRKTITETPSGKVLVELWRKDDRDGDDNTPDFKYQSDTTAISLCAVALQVHVANAEAKAATLKQEYTPCQPIVQVDISGSKMSWTSLSA